MQQWRWFRWRGSPEVPSPHPRAVRSGQVGPGGVGAAPAAGWVWEPAWPEEEGGGGAVLFAPWEGAGWCGQPFPGTEEPGSRLEPGSGALCLERTQT